MDFNFFSQADHAGFELEKARRSLELAKQQLESAKQTFEDVMNRAEENGISKPKLRKLVDERVGLLFESGLAESSGANTASPKVPVRISKKNGKKVGAITNDDESVQGFEATTELDLSASSIASLESDDSEDDSKTHGRNGLAPVQENEFGARLQ